ncbi:MULTISPECIES: LysE family transporter [Lactonifactor]|uniref:LysE family transporter n=3 Tax=Clostridiaceae TaxID=31979 RepID=UPI00299F7D55|nr:LysE family transporter [Lactonifactor longoviformis]
MRRSMMFPWFSFLTYAIITAVTPGPNNIMSMSNGIRKGFRGALPFNLGILTGFSLVMLLCTAFCSLLSSFIPRIKLPMLLAGACYMLYLAWETFRSSASVESSHSHDGFLPGLLLQFINPKIYIYCIMSMEAYILPYYAGQSLLLFGFALLLAFIGFVFTLLWSAFGSGFKWLFSRHARMVNTVMALLLVYCAFSLFLS